jgi:hypothetical protein
LACASRAKWKFWKVCLLVTRWSPQATNACKKTVPLCAWLTCRSLVVDVLEVRLVLAVKADLAVNQGQVLAARAVLALLVPQVVPVRAQVLPRHPPPKPAAPVRASLLWRSQAPTLA